MNKKYILVLVSLISWNAWSGPCDGGTAVIFGNGMFTLHASALKASYILAEEVRARMPESDRERLFARLAYNQNEKVSEQLLRVFVQKGIDRIEEVWTWLKNGSTLPRDAKDELEKIARAALLEDKPTFPEMDRHLKLYRELIEQGYRIVLVTHSQGNLYANRAIDLLPRELESHDDPSDLKRFFTNVQIASPAAATRLGSPWTTFPDDRVISGIRATLGALPANISSSGTQYEFFGHAFLEAYMTDVIARGKILDDVDSALKTLKAPPPRYFAVKTYFAPILGHEHMAVDYVDPDGREVTSIGRDSEIDGELIRPAYVACSDLRPGTTRIVAITHVDERRAFEFPFRGQITRPVGDPLNLAPLRIRARRGLTKWELGRIAVSEGKGIHSLEVTVSYHPEPIHL